MHRLNPCSTGAGEGGGQPSVKWGKGRISLPHPPQEPHQSLWSLGLAVWGGAVLGWSVRSPQDLPVTVFRKLTWLLHPHPQHHQGDTEGHSAACNYFRGGRNRIKPLLVTFSDQNRARRLCQTSLSCYKAQGEKGHWCGCKSYHAYRELSPVLGSGSGPLYLLVKAQS